MRFNECPSSFKNFCLHLQKMFLILVTPYQGFAYYMDVNGDEGFLDT